MVTTYFKNLIANTIWKTAGASALPEKYYLALSASEPMEDGTGVKEPSALSGYARAEMTGMSIASDGVVQNEITISWPTIMIDSGQVSHWALYDSAEIGSGNLLMGDAFEGVKHLDAGTTISIAMNGLTLRVLGA